MDNNTDNTLNSTNGNIMTNTSKITDGIAHPEQSNTNTPATATNKEEGGKNVNSTVKILPYATAFEAIGKALAEGKSLSDLMSKMNNSEVRKAALILFYLRNHIVQNGIDKLPEFKTFSASYPNWTSKSAYSEYLSMAIFLERCNPENKAFFEKFSTNLMKHAVILLKPLNVDLMNEKATALRNILSVKALSSEIIREALKKIFPDRETKPKGEKAVALDGLKAAIKRLSGTDAENGSANDDSVKYADIIAKIMPFINYSQAKSLLEELLKTLLSQPEGSALKSSRRELLGGSNEPKVDDEPKQVDEPKKINSIFAPIDANGGVIIEDMPSFFAKVVSIVSGLSISRDDDAINAIKLELERLHPLFNGIIHNSLTGAINNMGKAISSNGNFPSRMGKTLISLKTLASQDLESIANRRVG